MGNTWPINHLDDVTPFEAHMQNPRTSSQLLFSRSSGESLLVQIGVNDNLNFHLDSRGFATVCHFATEIMFRAFGLLNERRMKKLNDRVFTLKKPPPIISRSGAIGVNR